MLNILINKRLQGIGRAGDMCWISFGELIKMKNYKGDIVEKGEYALHLQCPWRIKDFNSKIILASRDIYEPNSKISWNDNFEWDIKGNNLFDENINKMFLDKNSILVKKVSISLNNDLTIIFSNKLVLECFTNISSEQECWRFFKTGADMHLIASGNIKVLQ